MPEGFDGVERGRAAGGHEAEDDANGGGKHERHHVDLGIEQKRRANDFGQRHAQPVGEKNPADASDARESDRLNQELQQHLASPRTDGQADSDLAGPLGDRYQHDVHDADAAD